jgi:hypothetical protein
MEMAADHGCGRWLMPGRMTTRIGLYGLCEEVALVHAGEGFDGFRAGLWRSGLRFFAADFGQRGGLSEPSCRAGRDPSSPADDLLEFNI